MICELCLNVYILQELFCLKTNTPHTNNSIGIQELRNQKLLTREWSTLKQLYTFPPNKCYQRWWTSDCKNRQQQQQQIGFFVFLSCTADNITKSIAICNIVLKWWTKNQRHHRGIQFHCFFNDYHRFVCWFRIQKLRFSSLVHLSRVNIVEWCWKKVSYFQKKKMTDIQASLLFSGVFILQWTHPDSVKY